MGYKYIKHKETPFIEWGKGAPINSNLQELEAGKWPQVQGQGGYQLRLIQCDTLSQKQQNPIYQPTQLNNQIKKKNEEENIVQLPSSLTQPNTLFQLVLYCLLEFQQCFPYWNQLKEMSHLLVHIQSTTQLTVWILVCDHTQ